MSEPEIQQEWVEKATDAFCDAQSTWLNVCIRAVLAAVIPLIRADERERCSKLRDERIADLEHSGGYDCANELRMFASAIRGAQPG